MKIHEHQAKELFSKAGVAVPRGYVAFSPAEARKAAENLKNLGVHAFVVKAQIHAGGRGKGGGVKIAKSLEEVETIAKSMLGMTLKTHQTGPEGQLVRRLWVEEANPPKRELYLSMVVDREVSAISVLASAEGGMDIEEVAAKHPEKMMKLAIDPGVGWQAFDSRRVARFLNVGQDKESAHLYPQLHDFLTNLYNLMWSKDCSQIEVNPLCVVGEGDKSRIVALDAKVNFDDNGKFRHQDVLEMRDLTEENAAEVEASKFDLSFIKLEGSIGCMVNGAGLAMATMDIIKHYGGEPANFLDVGGGATAEKVREAFKIILADKSVKAIFVNIFGGIMKCDTIAEGVIAAAKEVQIKVPLVVRLEGTNVDKGRQMLAASGLNITAATTMADGAEKVVKAIK
ncbi:MAG: ADP-forming succinate--CoA ligase subunit beta [Bdellovibrionales bacterium]|nr:ADP-forming succinate--CoA ligase subunit beta [Bdellovibrionales bacterium]